MFNFLQHYLIKDFPTLPGKCSWIFLFYSRAQATKATCRGSLSWLSEPLAWGHGTRVHMTGEKPEASVSPSELERAQVKASLETSKRPVKAKQTAMGQRRQGVGSRGLETRQRVRLNNRIQWNTRVSSFPRGKTAVEQVSSVSELVLVFSLLWAPKVWLQTCSHQHLFLSIP